MVLISFPWGTVYWCGLTSIQAWIFWSKVNLWNVNCARATAFIFDTRTGVLWKVSKSLRQKMSRPEGDSNLQPSDSRRMLYLIVLSVPDICCPMLFDTGPGGKEFFGMLTVRRQQHSFSTHERVFLGNGHGIISFPWGPVYWYGFTSIQAWISVYTSVIKCDINCLSNHRCNRCGLGMD